MRTRVWVGKIYFGAKQGFNQLSGGLDTEGIANNPEGGGSILRVPKAARDWKRKDGDAAGKGLEAGVTLITAKPSVEN